MSYINIYIYLQAFYGVLLPMDKDLYPNQVILIFSLAILEKIYYVTKDASYISRVVHIIMLYVINLGNHYS